MKVLVQRMNEGTRQSWWVTLVNDRNQRLTPHTFYWRPEDGPEKRAQAIQYAVMEVQEYADFFGVEPEPFYDEGVLVVPEFTLDTYADEPTQIARHKARQAKCSTI